MTFIHPLLLGGLLLAGVPVLLHLIMKQQPKHLIFPAFRFLQQQHRANQRKLRLRHLLLLALRMMLIALLCLALARPRVFSERINLGGDRPVLCVLVLDTSPSMGYTIAGRSRLADAQQRALELLDELPPNSRVAVLDTAEPGGEWTPTVSAARERIAGRELKAANGPVIGPIDAAYRLFEEREKERMEAGEDPQPRFLYVFTDLTPACWDNGRVTGLAQRRDKLPPPAVNAVLVDVGVEKPADLAIADLEVKPQAVPASAPVVLRVTVRATGLDADNVVQCRYDDSSDAPDQKPIKLDAGQSQVIIFERHGLAPGKHQAVVSFGTGDALAFDNVRYATFEVLPPRRVLVLTDDPGEGNPQRLAGALRASHEFDVDVKTTAEKEVRAFGPRDLEAYQVVCLLSVAQPGQVGGLWDKLDEYVKRGGSLAIFPGGEELVADDYRGSAAQRLLPGELKYPPLPRVPDGVKWGEWDYRHPLLAPFREWNVSPTVDFARSPPRAFRYWEVKPKADAEVLARYDDAAKRPALLETTFKRPDIGGRVLLFTTPFDARRDPGDLDWNDYLNQSFFLVLALQAVRYLAGDAEDANLNFPAGAAVPVPLPLSPRFPTYTLQGPGLSPSDILVQRPENANELRLAQAVMPGNFTLTGGGREWSAKFSVNAQPAESLLLPRVPPETVAELFGPDSVLAPGQNRKLSEMLDTHFRQPVELFPWLMILLLLALALENLMANKFYRQPAAEARKAA